MKTLALLAVLLSGTPALAQDLIAARNLPARTVLSSEHIKQPASSMARAYLGQELRVAIYAGRPIHPDDLRPPALINRNEKVEIIYEYEGLKITAEGRALARAAYGERIEVLNLSSKSKVTGKVEGAALVRVSGDQ